MIANRTKPKKAVKKTAKPLKKMKKAAAQEKTMKKIVENETVKRKTAKKEKTGRPAKPVKSSKVVELSPQQRAAETRMKNKRKAERKAKKEAAAAAALKEQKKLDRKAARDAEKAPTKQVKKAKKTKLDKIVETLPKVLPKKGKKAKPVQTAFDFAADVVRKKKAKTAKPDEAPIYKDDSTFGKVYARLLKFAQDGKGATVDKIFKKVDVRDREGVLQKIREKGKTLDRFRLAKLVSGNWRLRING